MSKRNLTDGATTRRIRRALPDSITLKGDPWAIGLSAVISTLHRLDAEHVRISWWSPTAGNGERPPGDHIAVSWSVDVYDDDGRAMVGGRSAFTTEHGVGIVEAGAECIKAILEMRAAT